MARQWPPGFATEKFGNHFIEEIGHDYILIDRQKLAMCPPKEDGSRSTLGQGIPANLRWLIYPKDGYEAEVAYKTLLTARAEFARLEAAKEQNEGLTEDDYSR